MQKPFKYNKFSFGQFTVLAVLCVMSGILLIMDNFDYIHGAWRMWPVFPLFLGFGGLFFFKSSAKKDLKCLGIGFFLVLVSLFFFVLNFKGWEHMDKFWPVFIAILGLSIIVVSFFANHRRWFAVSGIFLVMLASIFFLVFTVSPKLWPVSLILFGLWILAIPKRKLYE